MPDRYRAHRDRLVDAIGADGMAVVPAAGEQVRNDDVSHPFRQNSDFVYLTGFHEPDAVAVLVPGHSDGDYHLFVRPRERESEIWNGYRVGVEGARERFQADSAYPLAELDSRLPQLMLGREALFYRLGHPGHDSLMTSLLDKARSIRERTGRTVPTTIRDVSALLAEQRVVKDASEVESLRAAAMLSAEGHREGMRFARPGLYEYQIQAAMEYVWREGGSPRNGYPSIVGSGPNATILHYVDNDREVEAGDLILIDAAAEVDYYSADITRTYPVSGSFTSAQRAVYDVVWEAEKAGITASYPGSTVAQVTDAARVVVAAGLVDLGLIPRSVEDVLDMHLYREFFMHGVGHWLGLDVHDPGQYRIDGESRILEPGMTFTVEPGVYIAQDRPVVEFALLEHDLDGWMAERLIEGPEAKKRQQAARAEAPKLRHEIPEALLGLGVRIEDDILITEDGHENLSKFVPTDPSKIETLCAEESWLSRS